MQRNKAETYTINEELISLHINPIGSMFVL